MTVLKTRAKLVDVARQLFAKKGVEATTMNDIAVASKKGRRTLYTYFKSKDQIYMAVVESELKMLSDTMDKVAKKPTVPDEKILELITTHLDIIKMAVYRNGTLRADFFRDIWRVETMRKYFDNNEIKLFREVLREGKEQCRDNRRYIALLHQRNRGTIHSWTDRRGSGRRNRLAVCV